jgi:NAD(P)-dependent dehydrogenase (short-subunit alcohol dehydrogenase family)
MSTAVSAVLPSAKRLAGRKVIITGAASGMGKAIAELFAAEGAATALLDVQAQALGQVAAATGGVAVRVDISDEADVKRATAEAAAALGGLDGIVNAAGILRTLALEDTDADTWRRVHAVNLFGPYLLCNTALPALRASGEATIVNIASMGGINTPPLMAAYGASKAGLIGLTKGQAIEWAPRIRANAVCPGVIETPMTDDLWKDDPSKGLDGVRGRVGLRRKGTPMEVAYLALFLTSRESAFVNGAVYTIDGGPPGGTAQ